MEKDKFGINVNERLKIIGCKDNIYRYIVNAMLIFGSVYGSIRCFVSAFSIECYNWLLAIALLVIAIVYAFMHISPKVRKITYTIIFVTYIITIINFRVILKSGFSRMVNIFYAFIEDEFNLPVIQRYSEYYENSKLSVTACLIIIGFVMSLLLNIAISEYMSVIGVILLTLPIAQIGMYFDLKIDKVAYCMYIFSLLVVLGLKMSGKYYIIDKKAEYRVKLKKEKKFVFCKTEPKVQYQIAMTFASIVVVCILIFMPILSKIKILKNDTIKKSTNVYVKDIAISGLWGTLFDKGTGGMSGGKLGNIGVLRNDYKTDLELTYVPLEKNQPLYLKAFTGAEYNENMWITLKDSTKYGNDILKLWFGDGNKEKIAEYLDNNFNSNGKFQKVKQKMTVLNVGADNKYLYRPYNTTDIDSKLNIKYEYDDLKVSGDKTSYELEYYPLIEEYNGLKDLETEDFLYKRGVYNIYTEIPFSCESIVKDICEKFDVKLDSVGKLGLKYANREDEIKYKKECVNKIVDYLDKNYKYSLKCGKTPKNKDFVEYFLKYNKKGYCAHFASAAVMLFRELGIPARYIEGYVVDSNTSQKGSVVEKGNVEDFIEIHDEESVKNDYNIDKSKLNVKKVELSDANAHAWVEIYMNDFGWINVEVTPISENEDENYSTKGIFDGLLSIFSSDDNNNKVDSVTKKGNIEKIDIKENNLSRFLGVIKGLFIILLLAMILKMLIVRWIRKEKFKTFDYKKRAKYLFEYLCFVVGFYGYEKSESMTYDEYIDEMVKFKIIDNDEAKILINIIDEVGYSKHELTEEQIENLREIVEKIVDDLFEKMSMPRKIIGRCIKNI